MYLYKYVSRSILRKILETNMIRFTQTCYLNDPYEGHMYGEISRKIDIESYFKRQIESGEILANEMYELQAESIKKEPDRLEKAVSAAKKKFEQKYGVLSLTRNPCSLLMWAHYAENHKGCVIELNSKELPTRAKFDDVLFDIDNGTVVYSSVKNENFIIPKLVSSQIGLTLTHGNLDLTCLVEKSIHWAYEEEVRIIRDLSFRKYDHSFILEQNNENVYLFKLSKHAISSIITGARLDDDNLILRAQEASIPIKKASIANDKFELLIT